MQPLRPATAAEIESIAERSDLGPGCMVWALDTPQGAILGVVRQVVELDPVFFPAELPDRFKLLYARDVASGLAMAGVPQFYFNVAAADAKWRRIVESWGAETTSLEPELRYKKVLARGVPNVD